MGCIEKYKNSDEFLAKYALRTHNKSDSYTVRTFMYAWYLAFEKEDIK
jgi:hypothetical protein